MGSPPAYLQVVSLAFCWRILVKQGSDRTLQHFKGAKHLKLESESHRRSAECLVLGKSWPNAFCHWCFHPFGGMGADSLRKRAGWEEVRGAG